MRGSDVLTHLATHPGHKPADIARAIPGANPRAVQRALARMRAAAPPLVRAAGEANSREYYLTEAGASAVRDLDDGAAAHEDEDDGDALPPEPTPRPGPVLGDTPDRAALRRVSALLTTARIPTTEGGRILQIEERVKRLIDERDAADTRIDDELRKKALGAFANDPRLRYLASVVRPDDLLRAVVEAGLEAMAAGPARR